MNDLFAAVVHDVKNQLAELAMRLGKREELRSEMEIAMDAAQRLTKMLLVYREASDLLRVNVDSVSPSDFLAILAAEYKELFPSLVIDTDSSRAPVTAFFDDALVRLALGNALHNACRHAKSSIRLAAYEEDSMLVFEVSDDGAGYPKNILETEGRSPMAASGSGTGLGLYLAHKIAELHQLKERHGSIRLSNAPSARFLMYLP